jgi:hypothetical protein
MPKIRAPHLKKKKVDNPATTMADKLSLLINRKLPKKMIAKQRAK